MMFILGLIAGVGLGFGLATVLYIGVFKFERKE